MIISIIDLKSMPEFADFSEHELKRKLGAVEAKIRAYTHNNFQNTAIRFSSPVIGGKIAVTSPYINSEDTIQLSESSVNNGIYEVISTDKVITVSRKLFDCNHLLVTKIEYPDDIVEGAVAMLKYDIQRRGKEGVQSETISRHSVTYFDVSETNQAIGYPVSLISFLKPYMKARF